MIKKIFCASFLFLLFSCGGIDFVLKEEGSSSRINNNTSIILSGKESRIFSQELYSFFGSGEKNEFILIASLSEKKENILVKKNQVAEKTDYEIIISYEMFYKDIGCKIFNKKIITRFSFVPKSFGYNFGTDMSLERLYKNNYRKNIKNFIDLANKNDNLICIK
jgi:hypothetical protein